MAPLFFELAHPGHQRFSGVKAQKQGQFFHPQIRFAA
jgi:hypothetical protein